MRRVVGGAELAREQAGQGGHLIASGEQRESFGIGRANLLQAFCQQLKGALPRDRLKLTGAALAAGRAQQRLRQSRRRRLLHDSRRPLGADHALVQRVLRVALDRANFGAALALTQVDADAAAARTHVAGGRAHGRARLGHRGSRWIVQGSHRHLVWAPVPVKHGDRRIPAGAPEWRPDLSLRRLAQGLLAASIPGTGNWSYAIRGMGASACGCCASRYWPIGDWRAFGYSMR